MSVTDMTAPEIEAAVTAELALTEQIEQQGSLAHVAAGVAVVAHTMRNEIRESDQPWRTRGFIGASVGSFALKRFVTYPLLFAEAAAVLHETSQVVPTVPAVLATGAAAGTSYAIWTYGWSWVYGETSKRLPKTLAMGKNTFPKGTKYGSAALPGFEVAPGQEKLVEPASKLGRIANSKLVRGVKNAGKHIARGFTVSTIGTGAYIGAAGVHSQEDDKVQAIRKQCSFDGGGFQAAVWTGLAALLALSAKHNPDAIKNVYHHVNDMKILLPIAIGNAALSLGVKPAKDFACAKAADWAEKLPNRTYSDAWYAMHGLPSSNWHSRQINCK